MIEIPSHFFEVKYNGSQYPGVADGFALGSNCQHFCYEILRYFGFQMGDLRSSDLWEDVTYTEIVATPQVLDLVLFNKTLDPYGAHLGICVGEDKFLHLSKKNGKPVVWSLGEFRDLEEYAALIGFKRPIRNAVRAGQSIFKAQELITS